ncbi:hypothetical protein [Pseudomonas baetica]|uniref:hypothetical protein n=1 Tax=Pseudomonas baetica TaxID=674054 RepID=UPI0024077404|nr:hypothetical protein [Pseudomonas baetica]MDF9779052.1 hypothetical protein [Pseudomonas baetica]
MSKAKSGSFQKLATRVFQLPEDEAKRTRFFEGLDALMVECDTSVIASSVHHEMDYADKLEEELKESLGDMAVENLRQEFERSTRPSKLVKKLQVDEAHRIPGGSAEALDTVSKTNTRN